MNLTDFHKRTNGATTIGSFRLHHFIGSLGWTAFITPTNGTSPIGKMWIDEKLEVHYDGGVKEFPEGEVFLRGLEATWRSH